MAKRLLATLTDTTLFLQEWLANPQRTGSLVPSSRKLAAAMAHWLPSDPDSYVLELGPGTGAVTQALLEHGCATGFPAPISFPATHGSWMICCATATSRLPASAR